MKTGQFSSPSPTIPSRKLRQSNYARDSRLMWYAMPIKHQMPDIKELGGRREKRMGHHRHSGVLAAVFMVYGTFKLVGFQFGVGASVGETQLNHLSPYLVTWYFFNMSKLYHDCIGIAQIVTGLLLLFSRTAPIGAFCFLVIILNIVLINFGYNIATDVKILSSILLALDCVLLWRYRRRYRLLLLPEQVVDTLTAQWEQPNLPQPAERR